MLKNSHKHLTYDEIVRYTKASEEDFSWDNLDFFEEFEQQLDNCTVCNQRFRMYALLSSITGTKELEEEAEPERQP